jgi:hypothetical protein
MEKKQSSIDKFVQQLKRKGLLLTEDSEYIIAYLEAKAMHKEEIVESHHEGYYSFSHSGEQYYNETFGGETD